MLEFKTLGYGDLPELSKIYARDNEARVARGEKLLCDSLIGTTFLWRGYYDTKWTRVGDSAVLLASCEGTPMFSFPIGGDPTLALRQIGEYSHSHGMNMYFCFVPESDVPLFDEVFDVVFPSEEPDWSDYVYDKHEITELSGRKFHGQKNFVNRFRKMHPDASFAPITCENAHLISEFAVKWESLYSDGSRMSEAECASICELAAHWSEMNFCGGMIICDGEIFGFTVGEIVGDTVYIHFEKAMQNVPGAYQFLANEYLKSIDDLSVRFVNREEDMGIPGLRQSKTALHPVQMLKKYTVFCC